MDENRLKMNDTKTEFKLFGSRQQLVKCTIQSPSVNDCNIPWVNVNKYLRAYLDENLTLKTHIYEINVDLPWQIIIVSKT